LRILVTNDDGINAPGLVVAEKIARSLTDDVWVAAPEREQSGASHSLTLLNPLRLRKLDARHFAITGTPTDCVMMATAYLMKDRKPDLVLSGVNCGINAGEDVTYSGTVAGAMEGCILGIPSIALSQCYPEGEKHLTIWACSETHGPRVVRRLLDVGWPEGVLINVNFPDCQPEAVAGVVAVEQGIRDSQEVVIDERKDMRGLAYYWNGYRRGAYEADEHCDLGAVLKNRIAVTPLQLDLTARATLAAFGRVLAE
jgi:5'-nucleotidase